MYQANIASIFVLICLIGLSGCATAGLSEATHTPIPTMIATPLASPQSSSTKLPSQEQISAWTDEFLGKISKEGQFSGYIMIVHADTVLYSKSFDFSDRELKKPHTATTRYRIGSLTKQFTAAGIMVLESEGKLKLEDSACLYLANCPDKWKQITIHQLLSHTAGLINYTELPGYVAQQATPTTPDELMSRFADKSLQVIPAGEHSYSNSNYVVLGRIIEQISGKTYGTFLQERFFEPLGMQNTSYDLNPAGLAVGYATTTLEAAAIDTSVPFAAGGISSTAEDLLRWSKALYSAKVVPSEQLQKMMTPNGNAAQWRPGYGLFIGNIAGHRDIAHGGAIDGFRSSLDYYIDDDVTIIVLMNQERGDPGIIADSIATYLFGDK